MANRTYLLEDELLPELFDFSRDEIVAAQRVVRGEVADETEDIALAPLWLRLIGAALVVAGLCALLVIMGRTVVNPKPVSDVFTDNQAAPATLAPTQATDALTPTTAAVLTPTTTGSATPTTTGVAMPTTTTPAPTPSTTVPPAPSTTTPAPAPSTTVPPTPTTTVAPNPPGVTPPPPVQGTEWFRVANIAPQAAVTTSFVGGQAGASAPLDVQIGDRNTLWGASMTICVHRATADCTLGGDGVDVARWSLTLTDAAPTIVGDAGNNDWALNVRARTGSQATTTATFGFDVTIGSLATSGTDWVVDITVTDEGGATVAVTDTGAAVTPRASAAKASPSMWSQLRSLFGF